ncbi:hypothetical protein L596_016154 [Steinernema carpocapsae]|uniref:Uncharacterized protein n=1 Tax=Steinernema carpocapsae TaxID=34508 RepID=A0A4U5NHY2_STECR|nr:hypothetical protein L596_016154 [Steinernema carpocapsae]
MRPPGLRRPPKIFSLSILLGFDLWIKLQKEPSRRTNGEDLEGRLDSTPEFDISLKPNLKISCEEEHELQSI